MKSRAHFLADRKYSAVAAAAVVALIRSRVALIQLIKNVLNEIIAGLADRRGAKKINQLDYSGS